MPPKRNPGLSEAPPHYHGHRERLRARFREAGPEALADYEMLELILFRAIPQRDVKPLAKTLLEKFGSFAEVISAPPERLKEVDGLGEAAVTEFKIVRRRRSGSPRARCASGRCSPHGPRCSTIAAPRRPSPRRSSSASCSSTSATS